MKRAEKSALDEFVTEVSKGLEKVSDADEATRVVQKAIPRLLGDRAWLAAEHRNPSAREFTRSLIYRHPDLGFAVVATVWKPGQGTPVHDHGGVWGVEGVLEGTVRVIQYDVVGTEHSDEEIRIRQGRRIEARPGDIERLVPPFGHHRMVNVSDTPATTIHVFGDYPLKPRIYEDKGDGTFGLEIQGEHWEEIEAAREKRKAKPSPDQRPN